MSKQKIYCSYSRVDSEMVLKTVNRLKESGFDVWIDELDIGVGENWDEQIGMALEQSTYFLVFMSHASIQSSNVIDEWSYALNANKVLLPILIEDCELPMRIQRIQYLDFTGNYEDAFKALTRALGSFDETNNIEDSHVMVEGTQPTEKFTIDENDYNVFISYNHDDVKTALKIRDHLANSGIEVTIDQDSMDPGQEIKSFIKESIEKADAVLSLISNRSLKSGWVGVETFDTMFAESQSGKRKLIGCILDSDFYKSDYTTKTIDELDEEIETRKEILIKQLNQGVSVTDISSEIDRLRKLRQNFPETMQRLRDFKCINVSVDDEIAYNMDEFIHVLKRPKVI